MLVHAPKNITNELPSERDHFSSILKLLWDKHKTLVGWFMNIISLHVN